MFNRFANKPKPEPPKHTGANEVDMAKISHGVQTMEQRYGKVEGELRQVETELMQYVSNMITAL